MNLRDTFDIPVPAIVLAEGEFGSKGGKTANGVVTHSEVFDVRAVVDSGTAGQTPAEVLEKRDAPDVPIVECVDDALDIAPEAEALVIGVAPAGGQLPDAWVGDIEDALRAGCDIVSGLHYFLGDDEHWSGLADEHDARILDVRKPPEEDALRVGDGSVDDIDTDVVLTLGTDCAVGKRTTTFELYQAAREAGLNAGWVATGQTGIMVGAHEGVVIDRVPADFTGGVVEDMVKSVGADHDLVFVEGQASLTHRAYSSVTLGILHGAWPDAVVLADDPARTRRTHFDRFQIDGVEKEADLVKTLSDATIAGVSTWGDPKTERDRHEYPVANVYDEGGSEDLLGAVRDALQPEASGRTTGGGA
ncbi:Uncharacterized conserved protein, NAD-dependent epimerase/dehydratase family [Halorubrum aquaticum]|uniref:Uncharacterized conserved protein, NAD-dependent epimerase/dehydratase family n=1 Tax=Halorubrum aquaticum TaxID=387340 RepID=A0A1I2ZW73_9EURY|nr:DUF1611 domain-containing protein [Halorubrum aquaticum]SFH41739.1 Uncharacterized conserved protein, NAD-dependent epimerase/dehydratase family [Halorubrum aquaticum]